MPIENMFCFIFGEHCIKPFRRAKSVAVNIGIPNNTTHTFLEVGGY